MLRQKESPPRAVNMAGERPALSPSRTTRERVSRYSILITLYLFKVSSISRAPCPIRTLCPLAALCAPSARDSVSRYGTRVDRVHRPATRRPLRSLRRYTHARRAEKSRHKKEPPLLPLRAAPHTNYHALYICTLFLTHLHALFCAAGLPVDYWMNSTGGSPSSRTMGTPSALASGLCSASRVAALRQNSSSSTRSLRCFASEKPDNR